MRRELDLENRQTKKWKRTEKEVKGGNLCRRRRVNKGIRFLWKIRGGEELKGGNMNKRRPVIRKSRGEECSLEMERRRRS